MIGRIQIVSPVSYTHLLATKEERETIPDKSTEKHLALAYYDTLTGMFTRHGFFIHARGLLETFKARDEDFVLIQMNVRHFRIINNLYGMEKGNRLLVLLAERIRSIKSKESIAGRVGDDVFVVVMPRHDFYAENWERMLWSVEREAAEDVFHVHIQAGVFMGDSVNIPLSRMIESVSYTHLDVYKRQAYDMEGAEMQGIHGVGVTYGYGSRNALEEYGAETIVNSVDELYSYLSSLT